MATNQLSRVYRNLTRGNFSVQTRTNGDSGDWRVSDYVLSVALIGVTFKVNESGRQRTLAKCREVHAYVIGERVDSARVHDTGREIRYCPFERGSFYFVDSGADVAACDAVIMRDNRVFLGEILPH